jgi:hypothetical protein
LSLFTSLQLNTARNIPIKGAVRYTHKCVKFPEASAGAKDRIGFIDAFVNGPANIASKRMTLPIAIPAIGPISLLPVETLIITTIKKKLNSNSIIKTFIGSMEGIVAPKSLSGNRKSNTKEAAMAPIN